MALFVGVSVRLLHSCGLGFWVASSLVALWRLRVRPGSVGTCPGRGGLRGPYGSVWGLVGSGAGFTCGGGGGGRWGGGRLVTVVT